MEVMDVSPMLVWVVAASQLLTFGLTVWNLMMSGNRTNARLIADHAGMLQAHSSRLASLEQAMASLPAKEDLHQLRLALSGFQGELREMRALQASSADTMRRQEAVITRVEQYLLEKRT